MFLLQHLVDSLQQLPFRSTNITGGLTNSYPTCCLDYQRNILSISALLPPANEVCEGNVFTDVCLSTWGSLFRGGFCPGGLYPGGLCPGGPLSRGVSIQGKGLYPGEGSLSRERVSVQGKGLCPGEGSLSRGVSVRETPHTVTCGWYASYWNAFLFLQVIICLNFSVSTMKSIRRTKGNT